MNVFLFVVNARDFVSALANGPQGAYLSIVFQPSAQNGKARRAKYTTGL
ncbi:hypothetical protein PAMC26510_19195 [Caballeronia sordidicola]|uniref:Uncharacterized protein n=1 Tax=Caballeronia sordidicola TaxID=196367 RepID=A0A242MQY1_CABSO|nr:hypothetical protein PAMC26510_19195 [Caballeronia sordidicola]